MVEVSSFSTLFPQYRDGRRFVRCLQGRWHVASSKQPTASVLPSPFDACLGRSRAGEAGCVGGSVSCSSLSGRPPSNGHRSNKKKWKGSGQGQFQPPFQHMDTGSLLLARHGSSGPPQWQWPVPPCPYPSAPWSPPQTSGCPSGSQQGILGSCAQAYTTTNAPSQTDIEQAMHTLGISTPDPNWYMDTGATSHMTSSRGLSNRDSTHEM